MFNETIQKEIESISTQFESIKDDKNYTAFYMLLKRIVTVVEIKGKDKYDENFLHIYRSAYLCLDKLPTEQTDDDGRLLRREFNYIVPFL